MRAQFPAEAVHWRPAPSEGIDELALRTVNPVVGKVRRTPNDRITRPVIRLSNMRRPTGNLTAQDSRQFFTLL